MKKYLLFAGSDYYPEGGMKDYRFSHDTIEECEYFFFNDKELLANFSDNWGQIVEYSSMKVVKLLGSIEYHEKDHINEKIN